MIVTQKLLKQQYRQVARKYSIHVKEITSSDIRNICGDTVCGCIIAPSTQKQRLRLPPVNAQICKKHHIHKPSILINKRNSNYFKFATLCHEEGHIDCWQRRCFCMVCNLKSFQELHAMIFSLKKLMKTGATRGLTSDILYLHQYSIGNGLYRYKQHAIAAQMLKRSKVWKNEVLEHLLQKANSFTPADRRRILKMLKS